MITKNKNPGCTVLTKYKLAEQENEDSNDNDDKWIFCSDLDEIEITLLKDDGGTMSWGSMKVPPKNKQKLHKQRHFKGITLHLLASIIVN
jgi:hypothetical protein